MSTPALFRIDKKKHKLTLKKLNPSKDHLKTQGSTSIFSGLFLIGAYFFSSSYSTQSQEQSNMNMILVNYIIAPILIYIGLSLISASYRSKETLIFDKQSGLITYIKQVKKPWLYINNQFQIQSASPIITELLRYPINSVTSIHSMTVDTVDEFIDYLVFYFKEIDTYLAIWEHDSDGYKFPNEISIFLGKDTGENIGSSSFSFSLNIFNILNDVIKATFKHSKDKKFDTGKAFLSYDQRLMLSAILMFGSNEHIIKENPNDSYTYFMIALAYLNLGLKDSSLKYLKMAYQLYIKSGDKRHTKMIENHINYVSSNS
ncbi:hypothetical protein WJM97_10605 [Okeanomitos corallinicola TIOX110]|uniref:Uncharacterized protein n=1 Tax=Okeanomitos corallinicola TIOX110 TaxID=3133117 RepID=A0ABZ2V345_9CYAN